MELLEIVFVGEKSIPRSCLNLEAFFSLQLAINPIDFFYVLCISLKGWIRGLFIGIRRVLEALGSLEKLEPSLLVQVGKKNPIQCEKWLLSHLSARVSLSRACCALELTLSWVAWLCALDTLSSSSSCHGRFSEFCFEAMWWICLYFSLDTWESLKHKDNTKHYITMKIKA
jgi:hypothetical protein